MRVAITGGIAEGKSTVLAILASRGFSVLSADDVARKVFADPGTNARLAVAAGLRAPISRAELRAALASDPALRRRANGIMHPAIAAAMRADDAEFDEVPLLVETCRYGDYDAVWNVACLPAEKERRLRERYGEGGDFARIAAAQLPDRVRRLFADETIPTDGPLAATEARVEAALARWGLRPRSAARE